MLDANPLASISSLAGGANTATDNQQPALAGSPTAGVIATTSGNQATSASGASQTGGTSGQTGATSTADARLNTLQISDLARGLTTEAILGVRGAQQAMGELSGGDHSDLLVTVATNLESARQSVDASIGQLLGVLNGSNTGDSSGSGSSTSASSATTGASNGSGDTSTDTLRGLFNTVTDTVNRDVQAVGQIATGLTSSDLSIVPVMIGELQQVGRAIDSAVDNVVHIAALPHGQSSTGATSSTSGTTTGTSSNDTAAVNTLLATLSATAARNVSTLQLVGEDALLNGTGADITAVNQQLTQARSAVDAAIDQVHNALAGGGTTDTGGTSGGTNAGGTNNSGGTSNEGGTPTGGTANGGGTSGNESQAAALAAATNNGVASGGTVGTGGDTSGGGPVGGNGGAQGTGNGAANGSGTPLGNGSGSSGGSANGGTTSGGGSTTGGTSTGSVTSTSVVNSLLQTLGINIQNAVQAIQNAAVGRTSTTGAASSDTTLSTVADHRLHSIRDAVDLAIEELTTEAQLTQSSSATV